MGYSDVMVVVLPFHFRWPNQCIHNRYIQYSIELRVCVCVCVCLQQVILVDVDGLVRGFTEGQTLSCDTTGFSKRDSDQVNEELLLQSVLLYYYTTSICPLKSVCVSY